ncbi:hypothetical protein N7508_000996 [Penicillium antarcticum]|uniref:uncharacterized protein n=1 Tax=Penicillium antarcticum TaxID=416450 RepID=UPI0023862534|nr:uncharacterized protein N7508_000996 [Penicillium antarcticum]KAJ5316488.1 hypothetical protein N7508_000996 [Penicillium antarcticum]
MGKLVVKLKEAGIGLASEAIYAAWNRSSHQYSISNSSTGIASTKQSSQVILADEKISKELIQPTLSTEGYVNHDYSYLQRSSYLYINNMKSYYQGTSTMMDVSINRKATVTATDPKQDLDGYNDSVYSVDMQHEIDQAEAVWAQTENLQHARLPTYEESEWADAPLARVREATERQRHHVDHPSIQTEARVDRSHGLTSPVVIPQWGPSMEVPTFERAYAPILGNCGICQGVFLRFLEEFDQAKIDSRWLDVVIEVAAGAVRVTQTSSRANTFLDWANQELFMSNGLHAAILQFKYDVSGEQQDGLSVLSQKLGKPLFTTEKIDTNRPVTATGFKPPLASQKVEMPLIAHLIYPNLCSGELQTVHVKSAGSWAQDHIEKKAQSSKVSTINILTTSLLPA